MNSKNIQKQDLQFTKNYFMNRNILVVDPSTSFINIVIEVLISLGAERNSIFNSSSYEKAMQIVQQKKPAIIITEFHIEEHHGLELVNYQSEYIKDTLDKIFVIITSNATDSAVAEAAEEDADAYLLKPFSMDQLVSTLRDVIQSKVNPTPYSTKIREGQRLISEDKWADAEKAFLEAITLTKKPTLAHYYSGYSAEKLTHEKEAFKRYESGLGYNPIHYKCLLGKFEILFKQNKQVESYQVIRTISHNFPMTSHLLKRLFTLSIFTYNFQDVNSYFDFYTNLDRKPKDLTQIVAAAMLAAGKYSLKYKLLEASVESFKKCLYVSQTKIRHINEIIQIYIDYNCFDTASDFLRLYPAEEVGSPLYYQFDFITQSRSLTDEQIVNRGRELILKGSSSIEVYMILLGALKNLNSHNFLENLVYKASGEFPEHKADFFKFLEKDEET